MMEFNSFGAFATHLVKVAASLPVEEHEILELACEQIEKRAKDKVGEYQPGAGPFAAWAPLAESTKEDRARSGFPPDEPLLRTGEMRDSIEHKVVGSTGYVGSDSDIALWQELGTDRIPARSFLGSSAFELEPEIRRMAGVAYTACLSSERKRIVVR